MSSGSIDLGATFGSGGGGGGSVNSVTASAPLFSSGGANPDISIPKATSLIDGYLSSVDWSTFNGKQNAITGTAYNLMYFNAVGLPAGMPDFFQDATTLGLNAIINEQPNNGGGFTAHNWNINFDPIQNSPNENWNIFSIQTFFDINSSGFNQGISGQAAQLLSLNATHNGKGDIGGITGVNNGFSFGNGTDPISVKGYTAMGTFGNYHANVTVDGPIQGYLFSAGVDAAAISTSSFSVQGFVDSSNIGIPVNFYSSMSLNPTIASINNNNGYNGVAVNPTITSLTGNANVVAFNANATLPTFGAASGIVGLNVNPSIGTMGATSYYHGIDLYGVVTTSHGNIQGINISPTINGGDANYIGMQIFPHGTATLPSVHGINIGLDGMASSAQKQGLTITDGMIQVSSNYDTSILPASPGYMNLNSIGGLFTVASGHPMSSTLVFANQLATAALFQDNMGPDGFGGFIGFANIGLASQLSVASTKTVDTVNSVVAAFSVPSIPGDGGTVTNAGIYLCGGVLPGGGSLSVTNLYGFKLLSAFSSLATNAWGIFLDDSNIKNKLLGGIVVQTNTKSSNYTVDSGSIKDNVIFADTSAGSFTITLPSPMDGRELVIKDSKGTFGTNSLSVNPGSSKIDTISGVQSYSTNFQSITFVSNGTDWFIV